MTERVIPPGYWEAANGDLVPESRVKPIDKLRNDLVLELSREAERQAAELAKFKAKAMGDVAAFVAASVEQYGVKLGRDKGNVTLMSYDGRYKIVRAMQDQITFGEQLQAAKQLIDECVVDWAADSSDNIKALVQHAFQVDREGRINTSRVLSLRKLDIKDAKWQLAMQAISDSIQTGNTKPYIRFYKRSDGTGAYLPITLDVAAL